MEYNEALQKKTAGDWVLVGKICNITPMNASNTSRRPNAKRYTDVMNALVKVVEAREKIIALSLLTKNRK